MKRSPRQLIEAAFDAAFARRDAAVPEPMDDVFVLNVEDDDEFAALIQRRAKGYTVRVATGVAKQPHALWRDAHDAGVLRDLGDRSKGQFADEMTELSLTWLILHETEHVYLNHFQIIDAPFIAEGDCGHVFDVVRRGEVPSLPRLKLPTQDKRRASQCLELQADHEAMDIVLCSFGREEWPIFYRGAVAVAAVILLIERADVERGAKHDTHPPAAARLFQLLGHLCELWLVPAKRAARDQGSNQLDPANFPSDDLIASFNKAVCVPAFTDTVSLATLANSTTIASDMGNVDAFFWDIAIASGADAGKLGNLRTAGARHLMDLMPLNEPILEALGHKGLS